MGEGTETFDLGFHPSAVISADVEGSWVTRPLDTHSNQPNVRVFCPGEPPRTGELNRKEFEIKR